MIPEEINIQINQLAEQAQIFSSSQKWMTVQDRRDEVEDIKDQITELNEEINDVFEKIDNIVLDALLTDFDIDSWFEEIKEQTDFTELNPRLVYAREQREILKQNKLDKKNALQELEKKRKIVMQKKLEKKKEKEGLEKFQKRFV